MFIGSSSAVSVSQRPTRPTILPQPPAWWLGQLTEREFDFIMGCRYEYNLYKSVVYLDQAFTYSHSDELNPGQNDEENSPESPVSSTPATNSSNDRVVLAEQTS